MIQLKEKQKHLGIHGLRRCRDYLKRVRYEISTYLKSEVVRKLTKDIVHALWKHLGNMAMYGRGAGAVAEQLGVSWGKAQEIIETFYNEFPGVKSYIDERQQFCKFHGYAVTAYGRKRRLPDLQLQEFEVNSKQTKQPINEELVVQHIIQQLEETRNFNDRNEIIRYWDKQNVTIKNNGGFIAEATRQVINSEVQGTAADITKKAMLEVGNDKVLKDLGFRMLLTVHDEIIGEAPIENALKAKDRLAEVMIKSCSDVITVPMGIDTGIMKRWYGEDKTKELENIP